MRRPGLPGFGLLKHLDIRVRPAVLAYRRPLLVTSGLINAIAKPLSIFLNRRELRAILLFATCWRGDLRDALREIDEDLYERLEHIWQGTEPTARQPNLSTPHPGFEEPKDSICVIGVVVGTNSDVNAWGSRRRLENRRESGAASAPVDKHRRTSALKVESVTLTDRDSNQPRHR